MKFLVLNIIFLCLGIEIMGQQLSSLRFNRLTEEQGLSSNEVTSVAQDQNGIIWVGTENGLNRFDGYEFARFYANPADPNSIKSNSVENIYSDKQNCLWLSTVAGFCRFNTLTQKAEGFKSAVNPPAPFRVFDGSSVWFDKGNTNAYIVSPSGLYHLNERDRAETVATGFAAFTFNGVSYFSYAAIVTDRNDQLWAFRQNRIFRLNKVSKRVEEEYICPMPQVAIYSILFDRFNRCWVSTWENGLIRFEPRRNSWVPFPFKPKVNFVIKKAAEWEWRGDTYLVFATGEPSLIFVNERTLETHVRHFGPIVNAIHAPYVDRQNVLWLPSSAGLYYYPPSKKLFDIIPVSVPVAPGQKDPAAESVIYNIREAENGYWISRRYDGGLLQCNKRWKVLQYWPTVVDKVGKSFYGRLATLREGYDFRQVGKTLFVTTEFGMLEMDLTTSARRLVQCSWTKSVMRLRTIVPETADRWWIRSYDQGVFTFNPKKHQFIRHYSTGKVFNAGKQSEANYLIRDRKGRIYESTNTGIFRYVPALDSFVRIVDAEGQNLINSPMGMAEDGQGLLWIGTDAGVVAYNPDLNKVVKNFSENNAIGQVQRICVDNEQNVWFNSVAGYWCWLRNRDKVIQFKYDLGLPYNDGGAFYCTANGDVFGGGAGAVVQFFPKRLMNYNIDARAKIMDVFVNDTLRLFDKTASGQNLLKLKPRENNLRIHFDVINYDQLENNLFFYQLNPVQKEWRQVKNGILSFNNLAPGDYELKVKGGNKLTRNFTNTDVLFFSVKPFWYQTGWFILGCVLVILFGATLLVRRRIRMIRREAALSKRILETEMMALRSQMNPHFIFNSLSGIEYFIMRSEKRNASVYLNKFASLIRVILSNSRRDAVPFDEDLRTIGLYVDLELLRFNNNFKYLTDISPALSRADYLVPPLLVQPFVENAIVHGFANSKRKDLQLKISAWVEEDYIHYTIEDNGAGRKVSSAQQAANRPNHKSLGLMITQQRLSIFNEQHHATGSITIDDLVDESGGAKGTRVTVTIKTI